MTESLFWEYCVYCGKQFDHDHFRLMCDQCDGFIDVDYDMSRVKIHEDADDIVDKYGDLLPVLDRENRVRIGAGNTPTVKAVELGKLLGLDNLWLKDETKNPTMTTKDRAACVVMGYFKERGITHFTSSATGNSSTAFAVATIANPEFEHSIFIGRRWHQRLNFESHPRVHVWVLDDAQTPDAIGFSRKWEAEHDIPPEGGFFNLARREGLKTAYFEVIESVGHGFDFYFQGVSTAMGAYATFKGARQMMMMGKTDRVPRLMCVQEASCNPQVRAFEESASDIEPHHIVREPQGIADAILKGDPSTTYKYMYPIVRRTGGRFLQATTDELQVARSQMLELEGIDPANACALSLAALKHAIADGTIKKSDWVLLGITGADRDTSVYPKNYKHVKRNSDGEWEVVGEIQE